eukprot:2144653-Alexandrium_andersonii.AAC.1
MRLYCGERIDPTITAATQHSTLVGMHLVGDRATLGRMIEEVLVVRREISDGAPVVCRGHLGSPTLAPDEKLCAVGGRQGRCS